MKLILSKPCTYFSTDSPIKILDENKNVFFIHPNNENKINFNLPVGSFFTENTLYKRAFQPYEKFEGTNLTLSDLQKFKTSIGNNPHKASINTINKTILVDRKIANVKYKPLLKFLMLHECKHIEVGGNVYDGDRIIFDAEKACDAFATNYMLAFGWNPTQIQILKEILNDTDRKECIQHATTKHNFRR